MKRNVICDITCIFALLLLNLEWHSVISVDTTVPPEGTDSALLREAFTAVVHTELYNASGQTSNLFEQAESSTTFTEEAHISATDFGQQHTHVTEVSSDVNSSYGSSKLSTSQPLSHSASDWIQFSSLEQKIISASTPYATPYGTGIPLTDTTLCPSAQTTVNSVDATPYLLSSETSISASSETETSSSGDTYTTPCPSTQAAASYISMSDTTSFQLTEGTVISASTPCHSTRGTDTSLTSINTDTTPCLSSHFTVHSAAANEMETTPCTLTKQVSATVPSGTEMLPTVSDTDIAADNETDTTSCTITEQVDVSASTPCNSTYGTDTFLTCIDTNATLCLSSQSTDSSTSVSTSDSTPNDTSISASTPCGTDIYSNSGYVETTPFATTQVAVGSVTVSPTSMSDTILFPITEGTVISVSTPFPSTYGTDTSPTNINMNTSPCPPTQAALSSLSVNSIDSTPCLLSTDTSNSAITLLATDTSSTIGFTYTTPCHSTQAAVSSVTVSHTTLCPSTEGTVISASTPCPSTYCTDISLTSIDTDKTPFPFSQAEVTSKSVSKTEEMIVSLSTPCQLTEEPDVSYTGHNTDTTPCLTHHDVFGFSVLSKVSGTSVSSPCPTSYGIHTHLIGTDVVTSPGPSTEVAIMSLSDATPCQLTSETVDSSSTPCTLANATDTGSEVSITPCPLTEAPVISTSITPSTPCPSSYRTETPLTDGEADTTLCLSSQAQFTSATTSGIDSTPCKSTDGTRISSTMLSTASYATDVTSTGRVVGTTPCPSTQETSSSGINAIIMTNSTPCLLTTEVSISVNTSCSPTYGTEIHTGSTPCSSAQTEICSSAYGKDISSTSSTSLYHSTEIAFSSATLMDVTVPCLSTSVSASSPCFTSETGTSATGSVTGPSQTGVSFTTVSKIHATPCLSTEETVIGASTPCSTDVSTGMDIGPTTCPLTAAATSTETCSDIVTGTMPCLLSDETTISSSTLCPLTYGTESFSTETDAGTTPCPSTQVAVSSASSGSITPRVIEETSITTGIPCPSTYRMETPTGIDSGTTVCPSAIAADTSVPVSKIDTTQLVVTRDERISPCLSSYGTDISSSDTDTFTTTLCPSTEIGTDIGTVSTIDATSSLVTDVAKISSPCLSTYGTETSADNKFGTTLCPSAAVSSSIAGKVDTTSYPSTSDMSISTGTPCVSSYITDTSLISSEVGTTSCPLMQATITSMLVNNVDTTPCLPTSTADISVSIPCMSSNSAETSAAEHTMSSLYSSTDFSTHSVSSMGIPLSATQVSYDTETALVSRHTTYPAVELTTIFTSTPCPSTDGSDVPSASLETASVSRQTASHFITTSNTASSAEYIVANKVTSPVLLFQSSSIADYDLSFTTVDENTAETTLASSDQGSTFVDNVSDMEITADISFISEVYESASVSVIENESETSATTELSYSTDEYAQSTSFMEVPFSVSVDQSELSQTEYDSTTFTARPFVDVSSEMWQSYSAETETSAVENELDVTDAAKRVHSSTEADTHIVTSETPSINMMFSSETWMPLSITSGDDDKSMSNTTTSSMTDSVADIQWMFRAFQIAFTLTGRNYSDHLLDVSSPEYVTTATEILSQVRQLMNEDDGFMLESISDLKFIESEDGIGVTLDVSFTNPVNVSSLKQTLFLTLTNLSFAVDLSTLTVTEILDEVSVPDAGFPLWLMIVLILSALSSIVVSLMVILMVYSNLTSASVVPVQGSAFVRMEAGNGRWHLPQPQRRVWTSSLVNDSLPPSSQTVINVPRAADRQWTWMPVSSGR